MSGRVSRIAVLNRGEAATRCLRAIRELRGETGWELEGIAYYTDPDRFAAFVREADEAVSLGPALRGPADALRPAYLDHERMLAALRATRADSVWPGWGFLAEDASFVDRLEGAGLTFLGPSAETMRLLGDKITSKRLAETARVPVAPWSGGLVEREDLERIAGEIGFPLMVKATAGGGGRGIRLVESAEELFAQFRSARNEAQSSFGDGRLFLESCVKDARHVEVQIVADRFGSALALGLRDCSVQRRHQKIVEEGPPPGLSEALMREMREASVRLASAARYDGVATCEYLVTSDQRFYFLEVNPRLQVEHGVTEMLTGFDLVKAQIRIARGEPLPDVVPAERGHAIEVRVCAEDPAAGFAPSPGRIALLELPSGPGIRVDSGLVLDGSVPAEFDSMLAKVIAHGATREEARARLVRAVSDLGVVVEGGMTNKGFLIDILEHPEFRSGACHTGWLETAAVRTEAAACIEALCVAAIHTHQLEREAVRLNFFVEAARGRPRQIPPSTGTEVDLVYAGHPYRLKVFATGGRTYRVYLDGRVAPVSLPELGSYRYQLTMGGRSYNLLISASDVEFKIEIDGHLHRVQRDVGGRVRAPAPALVIEVSVEAGQQVQAGQRLGLLEAMKTETAFFAPVSGTVREVLVRGGERVSAGDPMLVIEPSAEPSPAASGHAPLRMAAEDDPLDALFGSDGERPDLAAASALGSGVRAEAVSVLRSETRRILMGYDVNPERAERLVDVLEAPVEGISHAFRAELAGLSRAIELFVDIESLFSRAPTRLEGDELGPSNDLRMANYLRRIELEGAGVDLPFLDLLRAALRHYDVPSLEPNDALRRAVLRLYATRTTLDLRTRLLVALLQLAIALGAQGETFQARPELEGALDRLALLRGTVTATIADLASHARFLLFERRRAPEPTQSAAPPSADLGLTRVAPPDPTLLAELAAPLDLDYEEADRIELWRFGNFDLERIHTFDGLYTFRGRARDQSGDERLFCIAEVNDLGPNVPEAPDLALFEQRFQEAIEALRVLQGQCDPARRLQWNRLYVLVRPPILLSPGLLTVALRRLAPQTPHLGLEKVLVRLASVDPASPEEPPRVIEVLAGNPTSSRVESSIRDVHALPLAPATPYERRVSAARGRRLIDPFEVIRLFREPEAGIGSAAARPIGPGSFREYDLFDGKARPVERPPGYNTCGVVIGVITTPTTKHPEGMRRILILGDASHGMGALAAPECDRIVAAIDLAAQQQLPVEWVAVSSGARIAMDSGTENLDATARVVRRIVTFTDGGGEINVIVAGVNVGAQSYFDALATMGMQTKGILVMLPTSYMVLTGRAALEVSGGVAAEDEVGIGGYERVMGPGAQAHYQARDIAAAYELLLEHYAVSYRAPGEGGPRRFATRDRSERDVTEFPCESEGFATIGEIFSAESNADRKRPFEMRPVMRALVDQDAGWLEAWRMWAGGETAIVWDCHLGGHPITLIGVESRPIARIGHVPNDGPDHWTAGTLFPQSSKKVARALNAASGTRPCVILANLSGFDGSPESMRRGILELGAEIARAVVRFRGPLLFAVVSRYHGGAYVVFSRELNDEMRVVALTGSFASVIGGPAAAAVVFPREVRRRANDDARVTEARERVARVLDPAARVSARARLDAILREVTLEKQAEVAAEFDAIHSVERAREVGSLEQILEPRGLRPALIRFLD